MLDITTYVLAKRYTQKLVDQRAGTTVNIFTASGQLDQDAIDQLKLSRATILVLDEKVYRLSRVEGDMYKYINTRTNGTSNLVNMTELDVNIESGEFLVKDIIVDSQPVEDLRRELEAHEADTSIHVTPAEKDFWNNKVSAEAVQDGSINTYNLNLTTM